MKTNKLITFLLTLSLVLALTSGRKHTTIFIIGDSTAAEKKNPATNPERGWGMMLQGFFDDDVLVDNHAVNGRSSKSFLDEGRWQQVLDKIKPGDYVFIQFGHNDEKPDPARHTTPGTTFDTNLTRYVNETRQHGGIPVLFSCVARRNFYHEVDSTIDDESLRNGRYIDDQVNSDTLVDTHGAYKDVPRQLASKLHVPFVDANKITRDLEQSLGVVASRNLHMWFKPGENPNIPQGRRDNTHYNIYGARVVAGLLADAIGRTIKPLGKHVVHYDAVVSTAGRGAYMTLSDAVAAFQGAKKSTIYVLDGRWTVKKHDLKFRKLKIVCYPGAEVSVQ